MFYQHHCIIAIIILIRYKTKALSKSVSKGKWEFEFGITLFLIDLHMIVLQRKSDPVCSAISRRIQIYSCIYHINGWISNGFIASGGRSRSWGGLYWVVPEPGELLPGAVPMRRIVARTEAGATEGCQGSGNFCT